MMLLLVCVPAFAADKQGFYFAPEIGYALPTDGDVDDTVFLGARLGYDVNTTWAVELESGWLQYGYDVDDGPQNIDIDAVPILVNARYNIPGCEGDKAQWYLFGGIGAVINDLEDNSLDLELDDSFAWQAGVGVDYPLDNAMSVFLDARYFWNKPDLSSDAPLLEDTHFDDVSLQSVMFVAGLKF